MILLSHGPEPCASANSAISAQTAFGFFTYLMGNYPYYVKRTAIAITVLMFNAGKGT